MHGEATRGSTVAFTCDAAATKANLLHEETQRRCAIHAFEALRVDSAIRPEDALNELLKNRSVYGGSDSTTCAPFVNALVSLPSGVGDSPLLETLLLEPVDDMLKGFADTMLRSQREVDQLVALNGRPNTYMDPVLKNNPKKYALFVRRCHAIGILDFTLQCKSELGIFFVKKKHNKLRMILDCRATNLLFKTPPPTSLVTGEGLGKIEVDIGDARDEFWASQ